MVLVNNFFKKFDSSIDSPKSIPIFQNQFLHVSKMQALKQFRNHKRQYGYKENRIITENYSLKVLFKGALQHYRVRLTLENFIYNKKYLNQAKKLWYTDIN